MTKNPVSVLILAYNEEKNLPACLESVAGQAAEIVVVDSGSTDRTPDIAKQFGARVVGHPFTNQAAQLNWALDSLEFSGAWILRLDADERMTPELWEELARALPAAPPSIAAFCIKRKVYFMGRWIRHGGYYPTWLVRLWRKGKARAEMRAVDEQMVVTAGEVARLREDFIDENRKDLEWWTDKHNRYATREVHELVGGALQSGGAGGTLGTEVERRRRRKNFYYRLPLFFRAWWYFLYRYVFRLGFLDGKEGLIFHFLQGFWYRFLVDAKLYEHRGTHTT